MAKLQALLLFGIIASVFVGAFGMGECIKPNAPKFCTMVRYNVTKDVHTPIPDPYNVGELDDAAREIYEKAVQGGYLKGKKCQDAFKNLVCGSQVMKCNEMNPLRPYAPCESVCHEYARQCGEPREIVCAIFGDPEHPDPHPQDTPFPMCKSSSSFPRFFKREWLGLMPTDSERRDKDEL